MVHVKLNPDGSIAFLWFANFKSDIKGKAIALLQGLWNLLYLGCPYNDRGWLFHVQEGGLHWIILGSGGKLA